MVHIMHVTEESCRADVGRETQMDVLGLCGHQQSVSCHSLCCIIEGLKERVSNGKGVQEGYNLVYKLY